MSMLLFILHELWSIIADSGSVVSSVVSSHPTLLSFHMLAGNVDRAQEDINMRTLDPETPETLPESYVNPDCARLRGAGLDRAQLQGAVLVGADLQNASLQHAQLQGAALRKAQLQGASLSEAQLRDADLSEAQLQGASLERADLCGA